MVRICNNPYPTDSKNNSWFNYYPYPLSDFQKYAIEAIIEGQHTLVTAHTGSGKTLPAEFAIRYFTSAEKKKKIIYTSPIKALSNQKYYEFTNKYPEISFGLFTGDIKTNPNADVLIMTTEILMNYLFLQNSNNSDNNTNKEDNIQQLQFQIDINTELACVIFDEVHYINDKDRGQVWEQTILMLPKHIQMVMLSATIDQPERFAEWCECRTIDTSSSNEPQEGSPKKEVYLVSTNHRVVPLTHYSYLTTIEMIFKREKDKEIQKSIRESTNTLITLQTADGEFQETSVHRINRMMDIFGKHNIYFKRKNVLNNLTEYLKQNDMLPAIAFVFSRKNVELFANEITTNLLEDDSKIPYTVQHTCEQILRKFPNYKEYLELPEYIQLVKLLERGIGIHHSGMIPVLREIVEMMISKKYIKLLFATESFAIGLDCPIKTAIFTSLTKYDGNGMRYLMSHEYTQMAGRAGRRGIDTVGHVIHCNQLFQNNQPTVNEYKMILSGKPQQLVSKFHIHYGVILNMFKKTEITNIKSICNFIQRTMLSREIGESVEGIRKEITELEMAREKKRELLKNNRISESEFFRIKELQENIPKLSNKKRKDAERELSGYKEQFRNFQEEIKRYSEYFDIIHKTEKEESRIQSIQKYIEIHVINIIKILEKYGFIERYEYNDKKITENEENEESWKLTPNGKNATIIAEIPPIIGATILSKWNFMKDFSIKQIIQIAVAFTDIRVKEDLRINQYPANNHFLRTKVDELREIVDNLDISEKLMDLDTGINYETILNYDLIDDIGLWVDCMNEQECKYFIQTVIYEKELSVGDFTKAVLKISTIIKEWINIAEQNEEIEFLHKLSQIDGIILKYITTAQSLYV